MNSLAFGIFVADAISKPVSPGNLSLWELIRSAGWVLFPLAVLSFIVVGLIVFNLFWLRKKYVASEAFLVVADRLIKDRNMEALLDLSERSNEMVARVLTQVISFARDNPRLDINSLEKVAEAEGNAQTMHLNLPTQLLMDMGVMAPMIGLLGTVYGILRSFGTLASDATPMRTMLLAGGVSQALVATAMGLTVGLTAMFAYAFFRGKVQRLITHLETSLTLLLLKTYECLAGH